MSLHYYYVPELCEPSQTLPQPQQTLALAGPVCAALSARHQMSVVLCTSVRRAMRLGTDCVDECSPVIPALAFQSLIHQTDSLKVHDTEKSICQDRKNHSNEIPRTWQLGRQ